jgi:hypothetical protein
MQHEKSSTIQSQITAVQMASFSHYESPQFDTHVANIHFDV